MPELVDIRVPDSQEGTEASVLEWLKNVGDRVTEHEPIVEISTDKVTMEIAATATGVLHEILKNPDDPVAPGDVLARISVGAAVPEAPAVDPNPPVDREPIPVATAKSSDEARHRLSPLVRRMIAKHDLDPGVIPGSGHGGRITQADVLAYLENPVAVKTMTPTDEPVEARTVEIVETLPEIGEAPVALEEPESTAALESQHESTVTVDESDEEEQVGVNEERTSAELRQGETLVPHSRMRRLIANHMVESVRESPHVTAVFDADLTAVMRHRTAHKAEASDKGIRLTYTAYFVRAAVEALQAVPVVNAHWHDEGVVISEHANIGVATALGEKGLIVPVLHQAESLDLMEIAQRLADLTDRARTGHLEQPDVERGTFTITNHGVTGSLIATPIINQPQAAILGIGKIEKRVRVVETESGDAVQIRPMVYVTLTIDHRVLDGFQANAFLSKFVEVLEGWE